MNLVFFSLIGAVLAQNAGSNASASLDLLPPTSFAVLGENATFRTSSSNQTFNPHGRTPPFIQVFDESFMSVLGPNPIFVQVASNATFAFAFEAPIYVPETDEIFFSSSLFDASSSQSNRVSKVKMADVEEALASNSSDINVPVETLDLPGTLNMTNGGTGPFQGSLLYSTEGFGQNPPVLALVDPKPPFNFTVILDNYFGRQFNSIDDLKIHPSGKVFFTDPSYGFVLGVRPPPLMPPQVYMFDPETASVQVVVGDIQMPNGIAFSPDGKIAYVTDTTGFGVNGVVQTLPALIYAFDVDPDTLMFMNKRAFAFPDSFLPDGIIVDSQGNVYAGCGEGVQVWNPKGRLLGKFFIGNSVANMAFAGDGRLMILGGHTLFIAKIAAKSGLFTL
ncbi:calcium-dependent phosphotriesterase [Cyathus striatus]|nr:calcium-dependent phosphotriesterase [Cyathus striatus]